jgi:hypothetical protein
MATLLLVQTPGPKWAVRQYPPSGHVVDPPLFTITGDVTIIGRAGMDIDITSPPVSRVHPRISHNAGGHIVEALRTRNHTRVNGQKAGRPGPDRHRRPRLRLPGIGDKAPPNGETVLVMSRSTQETWTRAPADLCGGGFGDWSLRFLNAS